jgi:hypothetical protein
VIAPLAVLAASRAAPASTRWILALAALALAWNARSSSAPTALSAHSLAVLARRETWISLGALSSVLVVYRTACLALDWRRRDADAFAGAPRSRLEIAFASWAGAWLAALLLALAVGALAEFNARAAHVAEREVGRAPIHSAAAATDELRLDVALEVPDGARWLELDLGFIATDVSALVELRATRGAAAHASRKLVSSRTRARVELPTAPGTVQVRLTRLEGRGVVFLATDEAVWLGAARSSRWASLALAAHAALAFAAWCALALGLGAHLPPTLAAAASLALSVPSFFGENAAWTHWSPWGALPQAFEALGLGLTPAWPDASNLATALAVVAFGLVFAARGLRTWRSAR